MAKHSLQFDTSEPDSDAVSSAVPGGSLSSSSDKASQSDANAPLDDDVEDRVSEAKVKGGWHTHDSVSEMEQKASSGKHSPKQGESASEGDDSDAAGSLPAFLKGKHAGGKGAFTADSAKYAKRAKAARRRKASIITSASIALVGTIVGVGLLALSDHVEGEGGTLAVTQSPTHNSTTSAIASAEEEMAFSLSTADSEVTNEFLEAQARAERQAPLESGASANSVEAQLDQFGAYDVTAEALMGLPGQKEPFAFALDEEDAVAPQLSDESAKAISAAIEDAGKGGSQVSCILVDLETGRGIAANLDAQPYGASAFKGPFCAFLCERADHGGNIEGIRDSIESVVVYSDNDAYDGLRSSMGDEDLAKWLAECGVPEDEQLHHDWYPLQSARQSCTMWLHIRDYLDTGSDNAKWLSGLFADTRVSFIRDGIGGKGVEVRNKGGWYAATWGDVDTWNGTCDAGIITCNGHTYLMSVMTGQPVSDEAMSNVSAIARALWDAREDLAYM